MSESEQREWWTLPQAAVWIRTRDLQSVRSLNDEAKAYFSAADGPFPDILAASIYLLEAFRLGRLVPRGWPRGASIGEVSGPGDPLRQHFSIEARLQEGDMGVEAVHPTQPTMDRLLIDAADVTGHWVSPATLLANGRLSLQRAAGRLEEDCLSWMLAHPDVVVTGLNNSGVPVPIHRRVFIAAFTVDPTNNALATSNGSLAWSAVTLELLATADQLSKARVAGAKPSKRDAAKAWLRENYSNGIPPATKNDALVNELKVAGIAVSEKTVRRALKEMGQNPAR